MEFLKYPNLPQKKVQAVLIDYRTDKEIVNALKAADVTVYFSYPAEELYDAVRGHADMSIHHLGANQFVCAPTAYSYYTSIFCSLNVDLIPGNSCLTSTYPLDAAYNVARIGNYAFHKITCTDKILLAALKSHAVTQVHIKQGYSKCNMCPISQSAFITEDESVYAAGRANHFDVLKIKKGFIRLEGFPYGFIGGATGLIDRGLLAVTGSLSQHPDYDKILHFLSKYGVKLYELTQQQPVDIGSILPLYE